MKKLLVIILLIALLTIPCFARTYTEEEFREVYNALVESNDLLKEAKVTITDLQAQVDKLTESNKTLISQLNSAKDELNSAYSLLDKAQKELENSAKIINKLNNQKILLGGGVGLSTDFNSIPIYGFKADFGYKIWLGYIGADLMIYNNKSFSFGVFYNIVL